MATQRNQFRVAHKPTATPSIGNWAVIHRPTQRIHSRHHSQAAAQRAAAARGSQLRRRR